MNRTFTFTAADATISDTALAAARAAGALIREAFLAARDGEAMHVEAKRGYFDIVTVTDRAAEAAASRVIRERVPSSRILGEEAGWSGEGEISWFIDPIDGTSNFASGLPFFCVSIAAYRGAQPVCGVIFDPIRDETFHVAAGVATLNGMTLRSGTHPLRESEAEVLSNAPHEGTHPSAGALAGFAQLVNSFRAVRRLGACALHIAYVAAGRAAACYETNFHAWDVAAGLQLAAAVGAQIDVRDAAGQPVAIEAAGLGAGHRLIAAAPGFDLGGSCLPALIEAGIL